jgi:hypothetical protein
MSRALTSFVERMTTGFTTNDTLVPPVTFLLPLI